MMLTRCPACTTTFRVTPEQVKARHGKVRCGRCQHVFNAIEFLVETPAAETAYSEPAPRELETQPAAVPPRPVGGVVAESGVASIATTATPAVPAAAATVAEPAAAAAIVTPAAAAPITEAPAAASVEELSVATRIDAPPKTGPVAALVTEPLSTPESSTASAARSVLSDPKATADAVAATDAALVADLPPVPSAVTAPEDTGAPPAAEGVALPPTEHAAAPPPAKAARPKPKSLPASPLSAGYLRATQRGPRWPWAIGSLAAALVLFAQLLVVFRTEVALWQPGARPLLEALCGYAECSIELPSNPGLVSIETSDLHPAPQQKGRLELTATIKNRAPFAQRWPSLELTLTDASDKPIVRKVIAPAQFLPPAIAAAGFPANAEQTVLVALEAGELPAAGYRLYLFYP